MNFVPGLALDKFEVWNEALQRRKQRHVLTHKSTERSIQTQRLNFRDPEVYDAKKINVEFNGKAYKYKNLIEEYRNSKHPNYSGTVKYAEQYHALIKEYKQSKILRKAEDFELPNVIINPMNVIQVKPGKFSLIVHSLDNSRYKKPDCQLMNILHRGNALVEAEEYRTEDLKSCYKWLKKRY